MCNNKEIVFNLVNGNSTHITNLSHVEKSKTFFLDILQGRIAELENELVATKFHLSETKKVLDAIPPCTLHGKSCIPHAIDWITRRVSETAINPNIEESKPDGKPVTEKRVHRSYVQNFAETYKVPMNVVRKIMRDKGQNGKYAKNRNIIYCALCELGYINQNN